MTNPLQLFLDESQGGHDNVQIDAFMLGSQGVTPWGKYKQACREIRSRWEGLKVLTIQIERAELEIQQLSESKKSGLNEISKKIVDLNIKERRMQIDKTLRSGRETERELYRLVCNAYRYREMLNIPDTPIRQLERDALDSNEWFETAKQRLAIAEMCHGAGRAEALQLGLRLPGKLKTEFAAFSVDKKQVEALMTKLRTTDNDAFLDPVPAKELEAFIKKEIPCLTQEAKKFLPH